MIERKYSDWVLCVCVWQNNNVSMCFMRKKTDKENVLSDIVAHVLSRRKSVCHVRKVRRSHCFEDSLTLC